MNMHSNDPGAQTIAPISQERYDSRILDRSTSNLPVSRGIPLTDAGKVRTNAVWRDSLALMKQHVPFGHRKVQANDKVYVCGKPFDTLYLISTGLFKIVNLVPDGREQPAGFFFKGDWLGFDGIPTGTHTCSAMALDMGELWTVRYDALLKASVSEPLLMRLVLAAVSSQLARNRDASLSMGTLSADARVADFILQWALSLEERGMRTDEIDLHMSRADVGSYLGLRLESVSRALSKLTRLGIVVFPEKGRRLISIPNLDALRHFIQESTDPHRDLH